MLPCCSSTVVSLLQRSLPRYAVSGLARRGELDSPPCSQLQVRHYRRRPPPTGKPPSLPPAKGKRYTVVNVPWGEPEEVRELLWRRHVYNWALTAIRHQFRRLNENREGAEGGFGLLEQRRAEQEEFDEILAENARTNEQMMKNRLEREEKEFEDFTQFLADEAQKEKAISDQDLEIKTSRVNELISRSAHFVTAENAADQIATALEHPLTHDHCIDMGGTAYPSPPPAKYLDTVPRVHTRPMYEATLGTSLEGGPPTQPAPPAVRKASTS